MREGVILVWAILWATRALFCISVRMLIHCSTEGTMIFSMISEVGMGLVLMIISNGIWFLPACFQLLYVNSIKVECVEPCLGVI